MDDLRNWTTVGVTNHSTGSWSAADVNRTNFCMALAILHRRPRGGMSVTISRQTSDERFVVKPDGEMTYQDGAQILVLVSTVTNTRRASINGHASIEAVQTSPSTWSRV